jgi:hypothetical protein
MHVMSLLSNIPGGQITISISQYFFRNETADGGLLRWQFACHNLPSKKTAAYIDLQDSQLSVFVRYRCSSRAGISIS